MRTTLILKCLALGTNSMAQIQEVTTAFFHKNIHDEDAPCSVCRPPRSTVIMIPGRNPCYRGLTLEYKGYLVAGYYGRSAASEYVCLDDNPDVMPG